MSRRTKWLLGLPGLGVVMAGAFYFSLAWTEGERAVAHPFFQASSGAGPLVIAHRGGAGLWPENTLYAFERARALGADVIELDVRATSDGELVVIHDPTVDRTTDGAGAVSGYTLAELKRLDAAHRWTRDEGRSFPLRGQGITVPTLREVFAALRGARFNIEPKQESPSLVVPLCRLVREYRLDDKVVVASFSQTVLDEWRRECGGVATSASPSEASRFLALYKAGLSGSYSPPMQALQVPEYAGGLQVLTRGFVEAAHERNLAVHAWTVNDPSDMKRILEMGVDGVMTDYPDRLLELLGRAPTR